MARVLGKDIPKNKRIEIALTYVYGIGPTRAKEVIKALNLDPNVRTRDLTEAQVAEINTYLNSKYVLEGDLRREVQGNIRRLVTIGSYRGMRHKLGLPVRGQKTKSNARTRKGKKKTVANKKK